MWCAHERDSGRNSQDIYDLNKPIRPLLRLLHKYCDEAWIYSVIWFTTFSRCPRKLRLHNLELEDRGEQNGQEWIHSDTRKFCGSETHSVALVSVRQLVGVSPRRSESMTTQSRIVDLDQLYRIMEGLPPWYPIREHRWKANSYMVSEFGRAGFVWPFLVLTGLNEKNLIDSKHDRRWTHSTPSGDRPKSVRTIGGGRKIWSATFSDELER